MVWLTRIDYYYYYCQYSTTANYTVGTLLSCPGAPHRHSVAAIAVMAVAGATIPAATLQKQTEIHGCNDGNSCCCRCCVSVRLLRLQLWESNVAGQSIAVLLLSSPLLLLLQGFPSLHARPCMRCAVVHGLHS
jgi:hypothetical protein